MTEVKKITDAEKIEIQVTVNDNRPKKKHVVGCKVNGYGMKGAKIICTNQVDEIIKNALINELKNRGFVLGANGATVLINAEIIKLKNKFKPGIFAGDALSETNLNIKVLNSDGSLRYNKNIIGKGERPDIQLASGRNARIALERSLKDAIAQIMDDAQFINAILGLKTDIREDAKVPKNHPTETEVSS